MPAIHFPQPDFEDDLTASDRGTTQSRRPPEKLLKLIQELEVLSGLGAEPGDIIVCQANVLPGELPPACDGLRFWNLDAIQTLLRETNESWQFEPWGWSATAIRLASNLGLSGSEPVAASVPLVNSRRFSATFDDVIDVDTGTHVELFGRLCTTIDEAIAEVRRHGADGNGKWVIKANISHAARNRILGSGVELRDEQTRWLEAQVAVAPVYVEPWVERVAECGLQFQIGRHQPSEERIRFLGAAEMMNDAMGQYRGSVLRPLRANSSPGHESEPGPWWAHSVEHGRKIALAAADHGFSGPMGIDCMLFRSDGKLRLRLAHDINGRRTMGRLALSLRRHVPAGHWGCWCFASSKSAQLISEAIRESSATSVQVMPTSPAMLSGRETTLRTCLLISADWARLNQVAQKILGQDIRGPFHGDFRRDSGWIR